MGLHHFADNAAGGSQHGAERGGLTPWGAALIARCEAAGVAVDLAHSSAAVVADALRVATKPLLVSHSGAAGACDSPRTLPDALLQAVAAQGVRRMHVRAASRWLVTDADPLCFRCANK